MIAIFVLIKKFWAIIADKIHANDSVNRTEELGR
jgi:hypothetical protein